MVGFSRCQGVPLHWGLRQLGLPPTPIKAL